MCCERHGHGSASGETSGCGCHDGKGHSFRRRYVTRAERLETLNDYLTDLRNETTAVEQAIAEIEAQG